MTQQRMSTNTRPELKFFLYSDPEEAKKPDNKRLVRVHVARNSHAKTRNARNKPTNTFQTRGEEQCLQLQAHCGELDGQVVNSQASSPSISSSSRTSPYPPGMFVVDPSLPKPSFPSPLAWLPSEGPARDRVQGLSPEEQFLLDHCESHPRTNAAKGSKQLRQSSGQM